MRPATVKDILSFLRSEYATSLMIRLHAHSIGFPTDGKRVRILARLEHGKPHGPAEVELENETGPFATCPIEYEYDDPAILT